MINKEKLRLEAEGLGLKLTEEMIEKFDRFAELLVETNKVMNLTAIKDPDEIAVKHFADSLSVFTAADIPEGASVIDIGTGAGFPGIPMLIFRPDLKLTMVDSTGKKLNFVRQTLEELNLSAEVIHTRAEELGQGAKRESYDFAVSRAVAALNVLSEYCIPFVKPGGEFIAMKGAKAAEELAAAKTAIKTLGGAFSKEFSLNLSDSAERSLIIIKKISQTPTKYPRPSAQISKKPL